jgi:hypothetical protein
MKMSFALIAVITFTSPTAAQTSDIVDPVTAKLMLTTSSCRPDRRVGQDRTDVDGFRIPNVYRGRGATLWSVRYHRDPHRVGLVFPHCVQIVAHPWRDLGLPLGPRGVGACSHQDPVIAFKALDHSVRIYIIEGDIPMISTYAAQCEELPPSHWKQFSNPTFLQRVNAAYRLDDSYVVDHELRENE